MTLILKRHFIWSRNTVTSNWHDPDVTKSWSIVFFPVVFNPDCPDCVSIMLWSLWVLWSSSFFTWSKNWLMEETFLWPQVTQQNTAYLFKAITMKTAWTLTFTARSLSAFNTNINSIVLCSQFPSYLLHMYYSPVSCLWCRLFCNSSHQVSLWPLTLDFNHFCPQNFY